MGVKNLLMMQANLVAGIFMLFAACSPVIPGSSETNLPTTSTNDNDTVDPSNLIQSQIELKIHTAISVILDKYFIDELNNKLLQLNNTIKQVNQDKEQTLAEYSEINKKYTKSLESLITCGNRVLSLIDHQDNLEKNLTILELKIQDIIDEKNNTKIEMKNIIDNKLQSVMCSKNQQYSNISLELEQKIDENNGMIQESIALEEERAEKLKTIENECQLNLTDKQQEVEILKEILFENVDESTKLLNILTVIMKFNENNVPDDLLEKRRKLFEKRYYNEEVAVVVGNLRKRFDYIALRSNSQFPNKYFCNKKISFYNSTICAFVSENLDSYEIDLSERNLAVLPKDIFTGLRNLKKLNLWYNRIDYLESSTFNNLSNLQILHIGYNNLAALSSGTFNGLEILEVLDMSGNKLNCLQPGTFNNLSNLQRLELDSNNLTALSSNIFNGLDKLEDLNLSWNKLNSLQPGTFNNLSNLKYLRIHKNHLTALLSNTFNGLEKLEVLDLSWNNLNSLQPGTFNNLSKLQKLELDNNNLAALLSDTFNGLEKLEVLDLSSNNLESLQPGAFNNLKNLQTLYIYKNSLTALSSDMFNALEKLTWLNLSQNKLNSLQPGTFNNLSNLKNLYIRHNNLTSLPKNIFTGLEKLEFLGLSNNRLNHLDLDIFYNLPALYYLDIQENNLTTDSINILQNIYNVPNFQLWL